MKKLIISIVILIFSLTLIPTVDAGQRDKGNKKGNRDRYQERSYKDPHGGRYQHRRYKKNRGHHYGHYKKGPFGRHYEKNYRGHWRSWRHWDDHYSKNRHRYPKGGYYHDNYGFLMFKFCDQGACFSFSIGH